jgi:hypothetical protein
MGFKVQVGSMVIEAETAEDVASLMRTIGGIPLPVAVVNGLPDPAPKDHRRVVGPKMGRLLIESATKEEALEKFVRSLNLTQKRCLRFLARAGERGASDDDFRSGAGLDPNHRLSGFTAGMSKRAPSYGLAKDDVLIVDFVGAVAGKRIYRYRMGDPLLALFRAKGWDREKEQEQQRLTVA